MFFFFFSSRRRHTRFKCDWNSDVCSSDLYAPELAGVPLAERLRPRVDVPVFVDKDVNALVLAEWMWGAGRGARSLAMLALGTGGGGGIVLDRRLHRRAAGRARALGHPPVDSDRPPRVC